MSSINADSILETINMIRVHHLDIRTVTLALSLRDCCDTDVKAAGEKIYNKITKYAKNLAAMANEIEEDYSIPIINKRISVTPISLVGESCKEYDYVYLAKVLDKAALDTGVNFIGGFGALVEKGCTRGDIALIESIPEALSQTERICSSINLASSKAGINMDAVLKMGTTIKKAAGLTADRDGIGAAKLVCFCNAPGDNPFMAGAFHGYGEAECALNIGVSGPGVVRAAIESLPKGASFGEMANKIKQTAYKITSTGELVGREMAKKTFTQVQLAQDSHSPSKVTRRLGKDNGMGYALGIQDMIPTSIKSAKDMASRTIETFRDRIKGFSISDEMWKINPQNLKINANQFIDYGAISGKINTQINTESLPEQVKQAVIEGMSQTSIPIEIEARTDEGVVFKKIQVKAREYEMQTGQPAFEF